MNSQFRKKKSSRTPNKQTSDISISKRLNSNLGSEFRSEMQDIEHENDNMLGSLIGEPEANRRPSDIINKIVTSNRLSQLNKKAKESITPSNNDYSEISLLDKTENRSYQIDKPVNNDNKANQGGYVQNENDNTQVDNKLIKEIVISKPAPQIPRKSYGSKKDIVLLVTALKKIAKAVDDENKSLKKQDLEYTTREEEYKKKIKALTLRIQELEIETRKSRERHADHIKFDLQDLDIKIKTMDDNLAKATGENSQESFLQDITVRNKEFLAKSKENAASMKRLKEHLANLRSTLLTMNTRVM